MKHTTHNRRRWLTRVALGLAVVAVAAPSAQGMILEGTTGNSGQVTDGLGRPLDPAAVKAGDQAPIVVVDASKFRIDAQVADEPVRPDDRPVRPTPADVVTPELIRPTPEVVRPGDAVGNTQAPEAAPTPVRPDDRPVRPTVGDPTQTPLDVPAPVGRVHGPVATDATSDQPKTAPVSSPSIDWNDAGVGIVIGLLASLVLLAGWMLFSNRKPDHLTGA